MAVKDLTPAQCILLAVHLASESNIPALHSFTPARPDAFDPELVLRILLTYLPEALDPKEYLDYVSEVASRLYLNVDREEVEVNTTAVKDISPEQASRRVRKLHLLKLQSPSFPPHAPSDVFTKFLCHRAYRIDAETGLLNLSASLVEPFIDRNDYLRTWYIAVVLPLLRMELEYYPQESAAAMSLVDFERLSGREGVDRLLQMAVVQERKHEAQKDAPKAQIGRDIKSLVGPWMYGHTERKRGHAERDEASSKREDPSTADVTRKTGKIALTGVGVEDATGHDWEYVYRWMVFHATDNFSFVARAVEEWDGPSDVNLGGFGRTDVNYLDEEVQSKLELQYAQAAFASCYAAQANTSQTVRDAHAILARLAELLDFIPPPDLASSVDSLPRIERHATRLEQSHTTADLSPEALLQPEHPLTTPRMDTYMLLQMMVYSAYQFAGMGYSLSLVSVAKLHFYSTAAEQLEVLRKVLRNIAQSGARKDESQWQADRAKLLWLWNWGIEPDEDASTGHGVLGKIDNETFQEEVLKTLIDTNGYQFVITNYLSAEPQSSLSMQRSEKIIIVKAMEAYDGASNGNKTRGGMKKANDIITIFGPSFKGSLEFRRASALIAATHALSFYSLTLQHGVPFQPVSVRVSEDPVMLVTKVLEQNPKSYTKLDDLISIAQNFVSAGLVKPDFDFYNVSQTSSPAEANIAQLKKTVERRVTFMAIEAALREDDFETAYSYIVNRLTPSEAVTSTAPAVAKPRDQGHIKRSSLAKKTAHEDDISWRAAFLAGRYRPTAASPPSLRRLEQRTELLALALLLAPVAALTDVLTAWRRCEEETLALVAAQQAAEQEFDDRAHKRLSGGAIASPASPLPGHFAVPGEQPALVLNQQRRELGRMGAGSGGGRRHGNDEAPLSMFDLTRNAARAFSKNAFTAGGGGGGGNRGASDQEDPASPRPSGDDGIERPWSPSGGNERVRKRDMVANAVSGGLASGLGWMLGATPVNQQQQQHEQEQGE